VEDEVISYSQFVGCVGMLQGLWLWPIHPEDGGKPFLRNSGTNFLPYTF